MPDAAFLDRQHQDQRWRAGHVYRTQCARCVRNCRHKGRFNQLGSGGYLLEVDERSGEAYCFKSTMTAMIFCANDPETHNEAGWEKQRAYISRYVAKTDSAIFGSQYRSADAGYAALIDVGSAVD